MQPFTIGPDGSLAGPDADDLAHAQAQVTRYTEQADTALARFHQAMDDLHDAQRHQATAAATAATTIAGVHDDGLDDSFWNNLGGVTHTIGHVLNQYVVQPVVTAAVWTWNHIDTIAGYLAIASLALGWIPIVGQILDAVTLVVGLVAVIKAGIGVGEAYAHHQDTGKAWEELGMAALGVVSFGAGRVAGKGLEMAAETASTASKATHTVSELAEAETATTRAADAAEDVSSYVERAGDVSMGSKVKELFSVLNPKEIVADMADDLRGAKTLVRQVGDHEYDLGSAVREGLGTNPVAKLLNTTDKTWDMMRSTRTIGGTFSSIGIVASRAADVVSKIHDINTAFAQTTGHDE